jgi:hypothetical protein
MRANTFSRPDKYRSEGLLGRSNPMVGRFWRICSLLVETSSNRRTCRPECPRCRAALRLGRTVAFRSRRRNSGLLHFRNLIWRGSTLAYLFGYGSYRRACGPLRREEHRSAAGNPDNGIARRIGVRRRIHNVPYHIGIHRFWLAIEPPLLTVDLHRSD